jgi:hypothetical protein
VLAARGGAAPGAFAAAAAEALPPDFASLAGRQAELEDLLRTLTRAVADGVVIVVIHAALDPARPVPAIPARREPRSSYTAAPVRSGHPYRTRKRKPGLPP